MIQKIIQSPRGFNKGALFSNCPAITSSRWQDNNFVTEYKIFHDFRSYRIRKLTPRECFRLMGVPRKRYRQYSEIRNQQDAKNIKWPGTALL